MRPAIVELEDIGCKMGHKYLLKNINWTIHEGDRWVVFGMNGSGKTTLLSIIAGFRNYTEGSLRLFGAPPSAENIIDIRQKIGWVSASFFDKYYSEESALDIVLSGKYGSLGVEDSITLADRHRARALLSELGLGARADHPFDMLSKGERQNVLIARALFPVPRILVLDEPCTGLDIYNREYLFRTLETLAEWHKITLIYVTHYLEEIKPFFDQALLLKHGGIFAKGATAAVFEDAAISRFLDCDVRVHQDEWGMHLRIPDVQPNITRFLAEEEVGV